MAQTKFLEHATESCEYTETNIPQRPVTVELLALIIMVVIALGTTWLLDGLDGNLAGSLTGILKRLETLGLTDAQVGLSATVYLAGSLIGQSRLGMPPTGWAERSCSS